MCQKNLHIAYLLTLFGAKLYFIESGRFRNGEPGKCLENERVELSVVMWFSQYCNRLNSNE